MNTEELKSKLAKRSINKGSNYERKIAKLFCSYFGLDARDWQQHFLRTKRTTGGQPHGDLLPAGEMARIWAGSPFGTIECKDRNTEWTFDQVFKSPNTCKLVEYWFKSQEDTNDDTTIVFFTKNGITDYVLFKDDGFSDDYPILKFGSRDGAYFVIMTARDFFRSFFPHSI